MNIALIIAGGTGARMGQDIPKQFLTVNDRPVIVHTLEVFQNHAEIDAIAVVCVKGWTEFVHSYAQQFNITKLKLVVEGGDNGQSSIRNGINALHEIHSPDDIVLIHDAIRPLVSSEIISDCLVVTRAHGNAVATIPCAEAMLTTEDGRASTGSIPRDRLRRTQTPQGFRLGDIHGLHQKALAEGITNSVASCTLVEELGGTMHFSMGSERNVKLTTIEDIDIFRALLSATRASWLK